MKKTIVSLVAVAAIAVAYVVSTAGAALADRPACC
jgi:hypothetical protein